MSTDTMTIDAMVTDYATKSEWLQARKKFIGSTDVSAIIGKNPYDTPYSVWIQKTGRADGKPETPLMRWGTLSEPAIAEMYTAETGVELRRVHRVFQRGTIGASIDYLPADPLKDFIVECKTVGQHVQTSWNDAIPEHYYIQAQMQMYCSGYEWVDFAIVCRETGDFEIFTVKYDAGYATEIAAQAEAWWEQYVLTDTEPPRTPDEWKEAEVDTFKTITADPLIEQTYEQLMLVREQISVLKETEEKYKDAIKEVMKDAALLIGIDGTPLCTWKSRANTKFDAKGLQKDHPDIYAQYVTEATTRTFTPKERK